MKWIAVFGMAVTCFLGSCVTSSDYAASETADVAEDPASVEAVDSAKVVVESEPPEPAPPPKPTFLVRSGSSYLSNGVLDMVTDYIYEDNLLIEERRTYSDGSPAGSVTYRYDDGLLTESTRLDEAGRAEAGHAYRYDAAGRLIKDTFLDSRGNPIFSYVYTYDGLGNRLTFEIFSSDEIALSYSEYLHENGKNTRVDSYSPDGVFQEYLERRFDSNGRPVLEVISDLMGNELEKKIYEYADGFLSRRESYVFTRKIGTEEYSYDEWGNVAIKIRYDRTGKMIERCEFTYIEVEQ